MRWEITPHGEGTAVVLLHRVLRQEPAAQYRAGWHHILGSLHIHLGSRFAPAAEMARTGSRERGAGCGQATS